MHKGYFTTKSQKSSMTERELFWFILLLYTSSYSCLPEIPHGQPSFSSKKKWLKGADVWTKPLGSGIYRRGVAKPLGVSWSCKGLCTYSGALNTHTNTHFGLFSYRYRWCFMKSIYRWGFTEPLYWWSFAHMQGTLCTHTYFVKPLGGLQIRRSLCKAPHRGKAPIGKLHNVPRHFAKFLYKGDFKLQ